MGHTLVSPHPSPPRLPRSAPGTARSSPIVRATVSHPEAPPTSSWLGSLPTDRLGQFCGTASSAALAVAAARNRQRSRWGSHRASCALPAKRPGARIAAEGEESYFKPLCDGDVLTASPGQRAVVACTFVLVAIGLARVAALLSASGSALSAVLPGCLLAVLAAAEFADLGTGVYHWAMDNYGSASTPVFGGQIEAFQGHHEEPWTITYRDFCNNCYPTCIATMPFLAAFVFLVSQPYVLLWGLIACTGISFCQELHKWSHTLRSQCHPLVNWLQERGLLLARKTHLRHHRPPFETNYCIVTGHMNPLLDRVGFFRQLEALVARWTGVQPRCETNTRFDYLVARRGASVGAQ